jgi:hypothetical protein
MQAPALAIVGLLALGLASCDRSVEGNPPPPGMAGSGTSEPGGRSQTAPPGAGLGGGMSGTSGLGMTGSFPSGTTTHASGAGAAAEGSPNRSPRSSVGTR